MKKRIFVLMITIALVFAVAGCGNSGKAEEKGDDPKPEVGAVDESESAETESDDEKRTEEAEEGTEAEDESGETAEENEAGPTESEEQSDPSSEEAAEREDITDAQIQEIYDSIKESVITKYLEPNGIDPKDFVWPKEVDGNYEDKEQVAWYYLVYMYDGYRLYGTLYDTTDFPYDMPSDQNKQLMDAVFDGIINWHQIPENSSLSLANLSVRFDRNLPANIDFTVE